MIGSSAVIERPSATVALTARPSCSEYFYHGGRARAFARDRIRSFRGHARGRRVYHLILKHGHLIYRD